MAPLALVTGVLIGGVLPAVYERWALGVRASEAAVWAQQVAGRLEGLARARPGLWPYDRLSIAERVAPLIDDPVRAEVRLDIAERDAIFRAGRPAGSGVVNGWAVVRSGGRAVARVEVRLPTDVAHRSAHLLWIVGPLVGAALAAALFFLPVATIRRSDARNQALWKALVEANASLEARVEARTAELRQRERQLQELGARLVAAQEEERARISRDLHDDLGQVLTGLRLRLAAIEAALGPGANQAQGHLAAAMAAVDGGVQEVRRLAHALRPPALDALGVADAIGSHARGWAEVAGLALHAELRPITPSAEVAEVLFRVAQEALTNVARHARAASVWLTLEAADDGFRLVVDDDGQGLAGAPSGGRLGLVGARERVEQAGGYLDIEDGPRGGVRLVVWLPAPEGCHRG